MPATSMGLTPPEPDGASNSNPGTPEQQPSDNPAIGDDKTQAFVRATMGSIRESRKYRGIDPGLVEHLIRGDIEKRIPDRDIEERVRSKLHQVGGAFFVGEPRFDRALDRLREAAESGYTSDWHKVCAQIMRAHASTAERLATLPLLYGTIIPQIEGPIRSVVDVACGLNPLAFPWMGLPKEVEYRCCDIYANVVEFLNEYFNIAHINGHAEVCDLTVTVPGIQADVALVLKTIPTLEQIDKSAGRRLLEALPARNLVVSFPIRSLGGKEKGMAAYYEAHFWKLVEPFGWEAKNFVIGNELVFLVKKRLT